MSSKIVDCFTFYNEIDLLEYRLNILDPYVDNFVLVEATRTHKGCDKRLYYYDNRERFAKFQHKIVHIIVDDLDPNPKIDPCPEQTDGVWKNENKQRNAIDRGLKLLHMHDDDFVIISDVDEIPNITTIINIINEKQTNYGNLVQDAYFYNLTCKTVYPWDFPKLIRYSYYVNNMNRQTNDIRRIYHSDINIQQGGWHLSYFGDVSFIQNKLNQFAHQEYNTEQYTSTENIENCIQNSIELFKRDANPAIYIPIDQNNNLPPQYEIYLQKYMGTYRAKIVDCFIFFNELELLEYRLNLLDPYVDYFVLVEATRSFKGSDKILYYDVNKERFAKFQHKIIHIIVDDLDPDPKIDLSLKHTDGIWQNEFKQRNAIDRGLQQLKINQDDFIIISDADEIPNMPPIIDAIQKKQTNYANLSQDFYNYNLTCKNINNWALPKLIRYSFYINYMKRNPQDIREKYNSDIYIENAGWHLSYFGDIAYIKNKINNFSHQEYNIDKYTSVENIEYCIKNNMELLHRNDFPMIYIPLEQNDNLPPLYETYLKKYMGK